MCNLVQQRCQLLILSLIEEQWAYHDVAESWSLCYGVPMTIAGPTKSVMVRIRSTLWAAGDGKHNVRVFDP